MTSLVVSVKENTNEEVTEEDYHECEKVEYEDCEERRPQVKRLKCKSTLSNTCAHKGSNLKNGKHLRAKAMMERKQK